LIFRSKSCGSTKRPLLRAKFYRDSGLKSHRWKDPADSRQGGAASTDRQKSAALQDDGENSSAFDTMRIAAFAPPRMSLEKRSKTGMFGIDSVAARRPGEPSCCGFGAILQARGPR
jgi:hypothetical protein